MRDRAGRFADIARELLTDLAREPGPVDLMADFTIRYPLTVLCDLIGVPLDRVDDAAAACRGMFSPDPAKAGAAMGALVGLAAAALQAGHDGLAAELRERMPAGMTDGDLHYQLFALLFAGQLTTPVQLG